jgi:hypothetical protein
MKRKERTPVGWSEPTPKSAFMQDGWYVDMEHYFIVFLTQS